MKRKDILMLLIPTLLFVIAWVGFSVWHSVVNTTISEVLNIQIAPIAPDFDTKTIDNLSNRNVVTPLFDTESTGLDAEGNPIKTTPTPSVTPTPTPADLNTETLNSTSNQEATTGGELTQ